MIILGSTGSIGTNALEVAAHFSIHIESLCAGRNIALLNKQIKQFSPKNVCIACRDDASNLISGDYKLFYGDEGILDMIESSHSPVVLNALVGFSGLAPSIKSLNNNKKLALANKESLVNAGWLMSMEDITPIDSEHFGLWYLTQNSQNLIKRLYITASGGAFRDYPLDKIATASPKEALNHPNWKMGHKITIDSASMVNKLFEILEAHWLFKTDKIDAVIESSSNVHALVEYVDGSITTHMSVPDMKLPIAYALSPKLAKSYSLTPSLNLSSLNLSFLDIDTNRYPLWILKDELLQTPQKGPILNASNEVAVAHFLASKIAFCDISRLILDINAHFANFDFASLKDIESIQALDKEVRIKSIEWLKGNGYAVI